MGFVQKRCSRGPAWRRAAYDEGLGVVASLGRRYCSGATIDWLELLGGGTQHLDAHEIRLRHPKPLRTSVRWCDRTPLFTWSTEECRRHGI